MTTTPMPDVGLQSDIPPADRVRFWAVQLYFIALFAILYFKHGQIDIVRGPFFLWLLWLGARKKLLLKFFFDPVSIAIQLFFVTVIISNWFNGIALGEILRIANWLYPYYLGKYVVLESDQRQVELVLLYFVIYSALFALPGILGLAFGFEHFLGVQLFQGNRYIFTMSAINRGGFYLAIGAIVAFYFLFKPEPKFRKRWLLYLAGLLIIFGGLAITQERKSMIMAAVVGVVCLIIQKRFKWVALMAVAGVILAVSVSIPQRFTLNDMVNNEGMQGRFNAWECAIGLFLEKPLVGHGYPSFREAATQYFEQNRDKFYFKYFTHYAIAHNLNLNALAETGLIGFLCLNLIFAAAWRFPLYFRSDPLIFFLGSVIAFIYITMQFGNFIHSSRRTDLAFLIVGLYYALDRHHREMAQATISEIGSRGLNGQDI